MVSEAVVIRAVGPDAFHRGSVYAKSGAVLSVVPTQRLGTHRLVGYVRGRARAPYTVVLTPHQRGLAAGFSGTGWISLCGQGSE
jgi:uncharacterized Zn finger protein